MEIVIFLIVVTVINLILAFLSQMHNYKNEMRTPIWGLAIILPVNAFIGHLSTLLPESEGILLSMRIFLGLNVLLTLFIIEFISIFLRSGEKKTDIIQFGNTSKMVLEIGIFFYNMFVSITRCNNSNMDNGTSG